MNAANNLTTWITFGGSYPGSLSGWMRLRFPHLVAGSVSSSGPLFAKLDYYEYLQVCETRRIRSREKLLQALQRYGIFMYAWN